MCVTTPSTWPWIAHLVSGSTPCDFSLYSNSLSLRLPYPVNLATECKSLTHYAKGTQSPQKGSYCLYACGFRFYFTPLPGFFFAFPSRYWFTIGRSLVFSLGGWSPLLQTGFLVSRLTSRFLSTIRTILNTGLSPSLAELSISFFYYPNYQKTRLLRVRSPLLPESRLISFPEDT